MARNSPSSIITYIQCPRLYYHQYIEKRSFYPNLDLIKGEIVHGVLHDFFSSNPPIIETNFKAWAQTNLMNSFMKRWDSKKSIFFILHLNEAELHEHYKDCLEMLEFWLSKFIEKIKGTELNFIEAFRTLKPMTEQQCYIQDLDIKGYIDIVEKENGEIRIIDYKTSSKFEITKEHKIQLAIYAYLYKQAYGITPHKVGIYFLREDLHLMAVDENMIQFAKEECKKISEKTKSKNVEDYPQNKGYLCKKLGANCPCHRYEEQEE